MVVVAVGYCFFLSSAYICLTALEHIGWATGNLGNDKEIQP